MDLVWPHLSLNMPTRACITTRPSPFECNGPQNPLSLVATLLLQLFYAPSSPIDSIAPDFLRLLFPALCSWGIFAIDWNCYKLRHLLSLTSSALLTSPRKVTCWVVRHLLHSHKVLSWVLHDSIPMFALRRCWFQTPVRGTHDIDWISISGNEHARVVCVRFTGLGVYGWVEPLPFRIGRVQDLEEPASSHTPTEENQLSKSAQSVVNLFQLSCESSTQTGQLYIRLACVGCRWISRQNTVSIPRPGIFSVTQPLKLVLIGTTTILVVMPSHPNAKSSPWYILC